MIPGGEEGSPAWTANTAKAAQLFSMHSLIS